MTLTQCHSNTCTERATPHQTLKLMYIAIQGFINQSLSYHDNNKLGSALSTGYFSVFLGSWHLTVLELPQPPV